MHRPLDARTIQLHHQQPILLGGGRQATLLLDLAEWCGAPIEAFRCFDDGCERGVAGPRGLPLEGTLAAGLRLALAGRSPVYIGLGSRCGALRHALRRCLQEAGVHLPPLIHPSVQAAPSARIGDAAIVFPGCVIGPRVRVGAGAILCHGVVLEHDVTVGENAWLATRAAASGYVRIGAHAFIGAGAVLSREAIIGDRSLIGAGAVVVADIDADTLTYGCPARPRGPAPGGGDTPRLDELELHACRVRSWALAASAPRTASLEILS